jgi:hypothetical protein
MGSIGRNEPCPCGSGRKYKKCCLATGGAVPYTATDRDAALQRLLRWIHPDDMDDARKNLWGEHLPRREQWKDTVLVQMAEHALHYWLFFDELEDGRTLADEILESERDLRRGERRYIEMGRECAMRLYEVINVEPGASVTLRDILQGSEIRVWERTASRSLHVWDLLAARVMPKGVSGQPERSTAGVFLSRRASETRWSTNSRSSKKTSTAPRPERQPSSFFSRRGSGRACRIWSTSTASLSS